MRRVAGAAALVLLLCAPALAACHVRPREHIVLYGSGDDPGVLLWNSQFGLRAYHVATFDEAQAMLPRATLVAAGTRAIVIRCLRRFVAAPYGLGFDDAVDVRILSGPHRGETGWIAAADTKMLP